MAQLVAHLHGMEGVGGSSPPRSTLDALQNMVKGWATFRTLSVDVRPKKRQK